MSRSGPAAAAAAAMPVSTGGTICAPSVQYTLTPLSPRGLWLAVTITPAIARRCRTVKASTGVGTGPGATLRERPLSRSRPRPADGQQPAYPPNATTARQFQPPLYQYAPPRR